MSHLRAFIAVQLSPEVKAALSTLGQRLANQLPDRAVRWVRPDRMHLTLRFLGDTAISKLPAIAAGLDEVTADQPSFQLQLDQLGFFPNPHRPRVIWVGLQGETGRLHSLKESIDRALMPLGWAREDRPFQAHLTLGRVKDSRPLRNMTWSAEGEIVILPVRAIHLIESQLRPSGPIYTVRHTSTLE